MRITIAVILAALLFVSARPAWSDQSSPPTALPQEGQPPTLAKALEPLGFLLGDWGGVGSGTPGASIGRASFSPDLQGHALLRRATNESPTGHHEDLMVIYPKAEGECRAFYVDNEEHVIHYSVTATSQPMGAVFLSDETPGAPRFRLTYQLGQDGLLTTIFAIAMPGSTEFKTYVEGTARRR